ncbi:MAG: HD domain-containing protein [Deltaproteobacteria bacterium]|nr:HD domain-containing protein [Deltaproteobacteria bacterium]
MVGTYSIDEIFELKKIDPPYQEVFELAIPYLKTRLNLPHTYIVYQYAQLLLKEEGGSPEIAIPACILHDVGWSAIPEDKQLTAFGPNGNDMVLRRKHETEGAIIADQILRKVGYDEALIPDILKIIDGHDTTREARSSEDAITKDSDKLFRLSALGYRIDAERFQEDLQNRARYLREKMDAWFLTKTGKELAIHELEMRARELREQRERSS